MLPYIRLESVQPLLTVSLVVAQRMARIQRTFYPSGFCGFYSNYIIVDSGFFSFLFPVVKINLIFRLAFCEVQIQNVIFFQCVFATFLCIY